MKAQTEEINTAVELWTNYRGRAYGKEILPRIQERELSLAFYAGMQALFLKVADLAVNASDEEAGVLGLEEFRQQIKAAALEANLDRSDGLS